MNCPFCGVEFRPDASWGVGWYACPRGDAIYNSNTHALYRARSGGDWDRVSYPATVHPPVVMKHKLLFDFFPDEARSSPCSCSSCSRRPT